MVVAACGGFSEPKLAPTATPLPTATPVPTPTPTPQPTLAVSLGDAGTSDAGIIACLAESLGETAARAVASGLLPPSDEESAALGGCLLAASGAVSPEAADPIMACLEKDLDSDLARAVASGAIPLTVEQEALVGNCVLSTSLGGGMSLSASVVVCLENALGADSARVVASGTATLSDEQQAALGGCRLASALGSGADTVSPGVMACLAEELGPEVAQVVASAALPLSAEEEQILGNCILKDALALNQSSKSIIFRPAEGAPR